MIPTKHDLFILLRDVDDVAILSLIYLCWSILCSSIYIQRICIK